MTCIHKSKCLAQGLESDEIVQFNSAVNHSRRINLGKHIYRMWDPVKSVFTVLSGSVKIYSLSENGSEHINGFYQSGDLIAADAIGVDLHPSSAVALEPTTICEIPVSFFYNRAKQMPQLQSSLIHQISSSLRNEEQHSVLLGQKSAEQRLALFLVNLSKRRKSSGLGHDNFRLSMSRSEIGKYLGLAMETVSRTLTRFQELQLITVQRKLIMIHDMDGLESLAMGDDDLETDEFTSKFHHPTSSTVQTRAAAEI